MSDNVIPFRSHPGQDHARWEEPILFATLYPSSSILNDPTSDEVDKSAMAERMFDATFHILADAEKAHALIALTDERNITFRQKDSFETRAQHEWLARRLDDVYETCTGRRRTFHPVRAFFSRLNPFRKGYPE